jgi:nucleoid-associated protein YgaU
MKQLRADVAERLKHPASWSPDVTTTYTVAAGDTLWSIAASELGDGARWQEIATLNHIKDADSIQPGQVLKLPKK